MLQTFAVMSTVYILEKKCGKTALELFAGTKPNISNMHIFGTIHFIYIQNKKKLDARSDKTVLVDNDKGNLAYVVYFSRNIRNLKC